MDDEETSQTPQLDEPQWERGRPPVVVGLDGSPESLVALRHARKLAQLLDAPLEIVWAWQLLPLAYAGYPPVMDWSPSDDARDALDAAVTGEFGTQVPDWLHARTRAGSPASVLLDAGKGARLLVVGGRGHGGFNGLLLGSVSEACARHAECPVLVVRPGGEPEDSADPHDDRRIVVGVDGSARSMNALLVAADLARREECALEAILVWRGPRLFAGGLGPELPWDPAADAEVALHRCVQDAFGPDIPARFTTSARQGSAAEVLIGAAAGARLLVVGSRGHGGFASLLLGSVAETCVRHSHSSVLVVHGDARAFTDAG